MVRPHELLEICRKELQRRTVTPMNLNGAVPAIHGEVIRRLPQQLVRPREKSKIRQTVNHRPSRTC